MKKFLCFALTVCMMFSLVVVAHAASKNTVNYYIRIDGVRIDTDGNVTNRDEEDYTSALYTTTLADTTLSRSSSITCGINGDESVIAGKVVQAPTDEEIFAALADAYKSIGYITATAAM